MWAGNTIWNACRAAALSDIVGLELGMPEPKIARQPCEMGPSTQHNLQGALVMADEARALGGCFDYDGRVACQSRAAGPCYA